MASAFVPCDLCFRHLARVNTSAAKRWLNLCIELTQEQPFLYHRYLFYPKERGDFELLEKNGLIVTHETADLNAVLVKLIGFDQRNCCICGHAHPSILNPHAKE